MNRINLYALIAFVCAIGLGGFAGQFPGCTAPQQADFKAGLVTVEADFNTFAHASLGAVTAALDNPAAVETAKTLLTAAIQKADPKAAPQLVSALAHVNAGNLTEAQTILKGVVSVSSTLVAPSPAPSPGK